MAQTTRKGRKKKDNKKSKVPTRNTKPKGRETNRVFTFKVFLTDGPMLEEFVKDNPEVSRTIEIRGDQTLDDLHGAIFRAFDRFDEHLYEFQFGKEPNDPEGERYAHPFALGGLGLEPMKPAKDASETRIDSLDLTVRQLFGYWFDFGDDWWHTMEVISISDEATGEGYPRVTKRVGESPPQYPPLEDEDYEDEEC